MKLLEKSGAPGEIRAPGPLVSAIGGLYAAGGASDNRGLSSSRCWGALITALTRSAVAMVETQLITIPKGRATAVLTMLKFVLR